MGGVVVQPEQRIISDWMRRIMRSRDWSADEWSRRANVSPTTITRAMQESYESFTTTTVLHRLARAAEVTSPLDALDPDNILVRRPKPDPQDIADVLVRVHELESRLSRVEQRSVP